MNGIICINKKQNITSFGVCAKLRGILGEKKVGHTGTLDPMAEGVLPVMIGGATRFLNFLPESDKGYRASFILGKTTDTLDITGNVTAEYEIKVSETDVSEVLKFFKGRIMQTPPMYSAVSVNGKRLYELARQGIEVERKEREIEIKRLELVENTNGEYVIDVFCSKGTYIRSLIDDIGRKLGCGAVMASLVRTSAMGFTLENCITLDELQQRKNENIGFDDILLPLDQALSAYDKITISPAQSVRFKNGGSLDLARIKKQLSKEEIYRIYNPEGAFLGLGQAVNEELIIKR
ncbi:MAG: tRNA pseudouridine(55) synthase TruB, partial [Eubacterium sp.]|nr:tRNA pseudouridine(55) synthase TruB [Eubacterium sp.]